MKIRLRLTHILFVVNAVGHMNNFTKEELVEIKRSLKYMTKGGVTPYSNLTVNLHKKLQFLIDNYCEDECLHETDAIMPSGIIHRCQGDIHNPFKCKKCGDALNDNQ